MEVLIISFYVYFPARVSIHNMLESLVLYLLLNITNVYGPTPPIENFQFQSAAPPPTTLKKLRRKRKPILRFPGF